ncbi:MAG: hypothetical protein KTR25_05500 [Myxococcales bacterium]|nr:hypothetical protein [Myxococcales bacterium]
MNNNNAGSEGVRYVQQNSPHNMMALGDPLARTVPKEVLNTPGGFAWWYVDTINADGDGVVVIWSFGLPFLPGYLSQARQGRGLAARLRPSFNISVYQNGKRAFYLLQEYDPEQVSYDPSGNFRFGENRITKETPGRLSLHIQCPIPNCRSPLIGSLQLHGAPALLPEGHQPSDRLEHRWTPVLGPSKLTGQLNTASEQYVVNGAAYHDRNEGTQRLDNLGIKYWSWGRLVTSSYTFIWYLLFPDAGEPLAWGIQINIGGEISLHSPLTIHLHHQQRSIFGLTTWRHLKLLDTSGEPWLMATFGHRLDNGPFYARTSATVKTAHAHGVGLSEWVAPARVDQAIHRPLVRMAVHRVNGSNSPWLPLFSGPRSGRMKRLLSWNAQDGG